ncbi:hypothetical protein SAMN04488689_11360 [Paenibacillus sp. cl6col]|uniref:Uncharacterized protein n=1 Tax=Paenibacillus alvei TaxID=44250 RepID=A0ABT4E4Y0_PAEAL|nr:MULTISPECIES: hypothetical protein [Paenibacillus]EPY09651.1 hypothetical protein PAAL66ix_26723 [Paenibacillus alvei A6-6i-x]MCY9528794.1 hypothetical protein [Paenibacillus alvei]SDG35642.1 hypothetical protein SAMN04488689_11360 [Paenibacillus sp. cl6col]
MKSKFIFVVSLILPILLLLIGNNGKQLGFPVPFVFYGPKEPLGHASEVFLWRNAVECSWRLDLYAVNVFIVYGTLLLVRNTVKQVTTRIFCK